MSRFLKPSLREFKQYRSPKKRYRYMINANESSYNLFNIFGEELIDEISKEELFRYPDSYDVRLRKSISDYVGVDEDRIICGNGADQIITFIIEAFTDKGDTVVVHGPSFEMYSLVTMMNGGKVVEVPDKGIEIDAEGIIDACNENDAKVIFLCAPNNPTGYMIPDGEIREILEKTDAVLAIDEAYIEFADGDHLDFLDNDRVILIRTFSKAFGLASARLGYGISSKEIIEDLNIVKPPYMLNGITQRLGAFAMDHRDRILKYRDRVIDERERIYNRLQDLDGIDCYPSQGNFLYLKGEKTGELLDAFLKRDILPRIYEENGATKALRITITDPDTNDYVADTIKEVCRAQR